MRRLAAPAALALAALAPAPALARPLELQRSLPAAASARPHWRTPVLRAGHRFDLLGATWNGSSGRVELRVRRRAAGRWTRWTAVDAGEPVWSGSADAVQLRGARPLRDVRVQFVAVARPAAAPRAVAAAGLRPAIVPRSAWDPHGDCRPRVRPAYGRVDFAIVHDTVSLNGYGPRDVPAMVLAICLFHRDGNGWNDIGYDLLVDRFGTVYEGRAGGVEQPVVGAQAQGWNAVSTGVAAIGDFQATPLPGGALHALARAIAWKLSLAGVPAGGTTTPERSIGGALNRWPAGARVRIARIAGHRDAGATDCPGNALYAQLPALRSLVARLAPAPRDLLTISPVAVPQRQGAPVPLTGRLVRATGRRPAGVPLVLRERVDGVWQDVGSAVTGADGIWSAAPALTLDGAVQALDPASGLASPAVSIAVRAGVRARLSARHPRLGATVELDGATTPPKAHVRIAIERRLRSGRFRRVRTRRASTADGRFAVPLRLPAAGVYRITVRTPTDRANAAGSSRPLALRVLASA